MCAPSGVDRREKGRAHRSGLGPVHQLYGGDVRSLQALRTLGDFEFNSLAFVQRFVPFRGDGGKVDENIFAGLALYESESLRSIEPLHCSLFFHFDSLFCLSYLEPFPSFRQQKRPASV
jgi:hypothetical protein